MYFNQKEARINKNEYDSWVGSKINLINNSIKQLTDHEDQSCT